MTDRRLFGAVVALFVASSASVVLANPRVVQSVSRQRVVVPPARIVHIKPIVPFVPAQPSGISPLYVYPYGYSPYGYSPFGYSSLGFGGLGLGLGFSPFGLSGSPVCQAAAYSPTLGELAGGDTGFAPGVLGGAPPVAEGLTPAQSAPYGFGASPYCQSPGMGWVSPSLGF